MMWAHLITLFSSIFANKRSWLFLHLLQQRCYSRNMMCLVLSGHSTHDLWTFKFLSLWRSLRSKDKNDGIGNPIFLLLKGIKLSMKRLFSTIKHLKLLNLKPSVDICSFIGSVSGAGIYFWFVKILVKSDSLSNLSPCFQRNKVLKNVFSANISLEMAVGNCAGSCKWPYNGCNCTCI